MELIGKLFDLLGTVIWAFIIVCLAGGALVVLVWWFVWRTMGG